MCGQSWIGCAASFLGMWALMMAAMMLPSLVPVLWRYCRSLVSAGVALPALPTAVVAAGYFVVWTLLGALVFPLGAAVAAISIRYAALAHAAPIATGLLVLTSGALQFTKWKARQLASCRGGCCHELLQCGRALPATTSTALRQGLRLGLHCSQCCAGLTAVLLVTGIMDMPAMAAVTAGITLERLAPGGARMARIIGIAVIGAGLLLTVRAIR